MSPFATDEGTQTLEVVPGGNLGTWQVQAVKRVFQTAELSANWDSYGSPPLSAQAVRTAISVILSVHLDDLPTPDVVPVPGGGIQLEWRMGSRELELEILPNGSLEFLKSEHGEPLEEGTLELSAIETTSLASWLLSG